MKLSTHPITKVNAICKITSVQVLLQDLLLQDEKTCNICR